MRQLHMNIFLGFSLLATGCNKPFFEVQGKVDGLGLSEGSAFWGGPFVVLTDSEMECTDFSWPQDRYNEDGESLSSTESFTALQFTYASTEIKDGPVSIAVRESGATGWFIDSDNGEADIWQATTGTIDITLDKKDRAEGEFEIGFGDAGTLEGTFLVENCENLKPRH